MKIVIRRALATKTEELYALIKQLVLSWSTTPLAKSTRLDERDVLRDRTCHATCALNSTA
eukprot:9476800-Pyramimonas_sp.AAC.1